MAMGVARPGWENYARWAVTCPPLFIFIYILLGSEWLSGQSRYRIAITSLVCQEGYTIGNLAYFVNYYLYQVAWQNKYSSYYWYPVDIYLAWRLPLRKLLISQFIWPRLESSWELKLEFVFKHNYIKLKCKLSRQ